MKAFLTTLLLLAAAQNAFAGSQIVHSRVCNYGYTEGVKVKRASGQSLRECINTKHLGEQYFTDSNSECVSGYAPGIRESRDGFVDKLCHKKSSLSEVYEVDVDYTCAKGYKPDLVILYNNQDFPSLYCIKN